MSFQKNLPHSLYPLWTPRSTCTDKQNALRRECTFKIELVLEIGVADLKITVLTLSDILARLAQSVRSWQMVIIVDFYQ